MRDTGDDAARANAGRPEDAAMNGEAGAASAAATAPDPGRVWLLLGDKRGDNAQVEILIEALGWRPERLHLEMRPPFDTAKPRYRPSLDHLDLARSAPLEPPWPDLIVTVGRRPSMAALWVREQTGGRTRIVLLGKPSGLLQHFDLVIVSGEVQIPGYPNVLKIGLPLMRPEPDALARATERWRPQLAPLPRPLVAFLVGGPTHPFVFDAAAVDRLASEVRRVAECGGTPYLSTSRRTPPSVVHALRRALPDGARLFEWSAGAEDNPYLGLLGLADAFVVTSDSLSMIVEVVRGGRPLSVFPLPLGAWGRVDQYRRRLARWLFAPPGNAPTDRLRAGAGRSLHRAGLLGHTRDFTAIHDMLFERGLATPVGVSPPATRPTAPDDLAVAVARVQHLIESA